MSLRTRLFLLVGGLVAALVVAQAVWVRTLTDALSEEVGTVAASVGRSVARVFVRMPPTCPDGEECPEMVTEGLPPGTDVRMFAVPLPDPAGTPEADAEKTVTAVVAHLDAGSHGKGGDKAPAADIAAEEAARQAIDRLVRLHAEGPEPALSLAGPNFTWHRIPIPEGGLQERLASFSRRLLAGSLGILLAGVALAALVAHRTTAPLRRLAAAAREVGDGALGTRVSDPAGGEVGQAIAAFNRMSDRLAELDAHNQRLAARRHLGEIGELARGFAHSLRNPLNALGLSVDELTGDPDAIRAEELAAAARRQIRRVDRALRSFLALASEGSGAATAVDLRAVADDVALEVLQDGPGVRVTVAAERELHLLAVEPELRAVLHALVVNAAEASPTGGEVEVELGAWEDGCRVEVRDRGPGLAETVRDRLFTPHVSTKAAGSGMGLFLAHRIAVGRYRGDLELADRSGGGTVATLRLRPRRDDADA